MTPATIAPDTVAGPEWWERIAPAVRAWALRHPLAARRVGAARTITLWVGIPVGVVTALLAPTIWPGLLQAIAVLIPLFIVWAVSPTRTVTFGALSRLIAVGIPVAFGIAALTTALSRSVGLIRFDAGGYAGLAGPVEEIGKLLPLIGLAVLAPRLVRRWATVDWVLAGYACGLGFYAVEHGLRLIGLQSPSFAQVEWIISGKPLHPVPELVPFVAGLEAHDEGLAAGHPVWTGLIGAAIGLALHLASRATSRATRAAAWVLPLGVLSLVVMWHAMSNTTLNIRSVDAFTTEGIPVVWAVGWFATGFGWPAPFLLVAFWVAALAIDVGRRERAAAAGVSTLTPRFEARAASVRSWATSPGRRIVGRVALAALQWSSDAVVVVAAFARRTGESRASALLRGRLRRSVAVRSRRAAAAASLRAPTQAGLRRARLLIVVATLAALVLAIVAGTAIAAAVGTSYSGTGDYLSPLIDYLTGAWYRLPWWGRAAVVAFALVGLVGLGATVGGASTFLGLTTFVLDREHQGAAEMIRREGLLPSLAHYVATRGPAQAVVDLIDLGLTFIPGARLGVPTVGGELADEVVEGFAQELAMDRAGRVGDWVDGRFHELIGGTVDPLGPPELRPPDHGTGSLRDPAPSAAGWDPTSGTRPPVVAEVRMTGVEGPLSNRNGFSPYTRYQSPDGAFVTTDGNGSPVYVEATTHEAALAEWRASDATVVRFPDGTVWGRTPGGEVWTIPAP